MYFYEIIRALCQKGVRQRQEQRRYKTQVFHILRLGEGSLAVQLVQFKPGESVTCLINAVTGEVKIEPKETTCRLFRHIRTRAYRRIFWDYCGRWKRPMYTALPRTCPWIVFIMFARVSKASVPGWTSTFVSRA